MYDRRRQTQFLVLLMSALLASPDLFAQNDASSRKPKSVTYTEPEASKDRYVAIMGEVNQPGTYHVHPTSMNLRSLVVQAAGFTLDASKVVRVIRNGRFSQNEIYSESSNSRLLDGDLLIVEPRQTHQFTGRMYDFSPERTMIHASYEERGKPAGIQVGLVNVLDYPIVLKLRPEDASAARIMEGLRQPIQLLADTDVITPGRRITSDAAKQLPRMIDGSVIVFKRESINRNQLPSTLPRPIESHIALGAQAGLIGSPQGQSPELRALGQKLWPGSGYSDLTIGNSGDGRTAPAKSPSASQTRAPADELRTEIAPRPPVSRNPRIATAPFSGVPQIKNSSTSLPIQEHDSTESAAMTDDSANETQTPMLESGEPLSAMESSETETPGFSLANILIVFSVVGMAIIVVIGARRFLEFERQAKSLASVNSAPKSIPEAPASIVTAPFESRSLLERLIKNELPINLEQVDFPAGLMLQGRIAPRPNLRVDGAQSVLKEQGPHISLPQNLPREREIVSKFDQAEAPSVRKPHFFDAERQTATDGVGSPLGSSDTQTKTPLAKALFELGKGDRS